MQNRYAAQVTGPSAIFPRGFLWLGAVWFAAAGLALWLAPWPPAWYRLPAAAGLAAALLTFLAVLGTLRNSAFLATTAGMSLGNRRGARRRGRRGRIRYLPWSDVAAIRIRSRPLGAVVQVTLAPVARAAALPTAGRHAGRAARWLLLLACPLACLCCRPALTLPAGDPPRYRIPLRAVGAGEVALGLRPLAPAGVAVIVASRRWSAQRASAPEPAIAPRAA